MNTPSHEQQLAINHIKNGRNAVIEAVAGSGKSTTMIGLAFQLAKTIILMVVFNVSLKVDMRGKAKTTGLQNLKIETFHSMVCKYYGVDAKNDDEIRRILSTNAKPSKEIPAFGIVVLDECQDMSDLYYDLMIKFIRDIAIQRPNHKLQLVLLGDRRQELYGFKGADFRFLTMGQQLWEQNAQLKSPEFALCELRTSYRITEQMAQFVNKAMLGETVFDTVKDGPKVVYIRGTLHDIKRQVCQLVLAKLKEGYKASDIFILNYSVKTQEMQQIENVLVEKGIPCFVPLNDDDKLDSRVIQHKLVFSTFHATKGQERPFVFLFSFDDSYFRFMERDSDGKTCPNTLYVGATRAQTELFLFESESNEKKPLPFLKMSHSEMRRQPFIDFRGNMFLFKNEMKMPSSSASSEKDTCVYYSPTKLVAFLPQDVLDELTLLSKRMFKKVSEPEDEFELDIPTTMETKNGLVEDVSAQLGNVIPSKYIDHITSVRHTAYDVMEGILSEMEKRKKSTHSIFRQKFATIRRDAMTLADDLLIGNMMEAIETKFIAKLYQIDYYGFLAQEVLDSIIARMSKFVSYDVFAPEAEVVISDNYDNDKIDAVNSILGNYFQNKKFVFTGRMDLTADDNWEFKCTTSLATEHFLQLMIYAWIWRVVYPDDVREFKLFNIKTGEVYWLELSSLDDLTPIMVILLKAKLNKKAKLSDEDFLEQHVQRPSTLTEELEE